MLVALSDVQTGPGYRNLKAEHGHFRNMFLCFHIQIKTDFLNQEKLLQTKEIKKHTSTHI